MSALRFIFSLAPMAITMWLLFHVPAHAASKLANYAGSDELAFGFGAIIMGLSACAVIVGHLCQRVKP